MDATVEAGVGTAPPGPRRQPLGLKLAHNARPDGSVSGCCVLPDVCRVSRDGLCDAPVEGACGSGGGDSGGGSGDGGGGGGGSGDARGVDLLESIPGGQAPAGFAHLESVPHWEEAPGGSALSLEVVPAVAAAVPSVAGTPCLAWYEQWVRLLRRLDSGRTPGILDLYCASGAFAEGVARAGGVALGVDSADQPHFTSRFGADAFVAGDALSVADLRLLVRRFRPIAVFASPPGDVDVGRLREVLVELGLPFLIATRNGPASSVRLAASMFGLGAY